MDITFSPVTPADKPRILQIAAQVWEGHDYLPAVLDDWLAATDAELIAARSGGELVGLARYTRMFPGYVWFEGLRTDPAWQGRGIGKALTQHMLARAVAEGIRRVGLSSYRDNIGSAKVIGAYGFRRVAGFVYLEAAEDGSTWEYAQFSAAVTAVTAAEALAFVRNSVFMSAAQGFCPHGWTFYPFALGPEVVLAQMAHLLGIRRGDHLVALLCAGRPLHGPGQFTMDFLEGETEAMATLVGHALHLAGQHTYIEAMAPSWGGAEAPALAVLRQFGLKSWSDYQPDVFVYECTP